AIRVFRDRMEEPWMRVLTNLSPEVYMKVLARAACAVGNSSSFVRDASFFGTPIVLVGNRQAGREVSDHVTNVPRVEARILEGVRAQLEHGPYQPSVLYGDGHISERLAEALVRVQPYTQKRLAYIRETSS